MGERYKESKYYGVNKFVMKSEKCEEDELKELKPGTYTKDEDYEESTKKNGSLEKYVRRNLKTKISVIKSHTRFIALLLHWISAFLQGARQSRKKSAINFWI